MKIHVPSFALGFGTAAVLISARETLRPVLVELGSLGLHLARIGIALVERQRERVEDLWADIEERARMRARNERRVSAVPEATPVH
jgi:hypothetical protein